MRLYLINLTGTTPVGATFTRCKTVRFDTPAEALAFGLEAAVDRNMNLDGVRDVTNLEGWLTYK